ncbi:omptin family outer membrane protease [Rhizobium leguminosarum]|uniref:omptin family outer membrane protease n=1 Tax=Rhizobium leguminosarum TaxID=384 RepID=UPI001C9186B3|nr:omptin family outer membrane protease [Rhizobium leguminosarum]
MKRVTTTGCAVTPCLLVATPSLAAADNTLFSSDDGNFVVFSGLGLANIKAQEFTYHGDHKVSQLNWESKGMTLFTVGVDAQIDNDWRLRAASKSAPAATVTWLTTTGLVPGTNDWTDRSIHPICPARLSGCFTAATKSKPRTPRMARTPLGRRLLPGQTFSRCRFPSA